MVNRYRLDQPGMLIFETATSGPGVVIPPQPNKGEQSFWPIPPWLRLHTKCLAELNALLSQSSKLVDDSCYQAIVFLYRLSVGPTYMTSALLRHCLVTLNGRLMTTGAFSGWRNWQDAPPGFA